MSISDKMREYALTQIGAPYVFGARGQTCTPAYRRGIKASTKTAHPTIVTKCQVLTGKRAACTGCAFAGRQCFDCRGLTACAAIAAGPAADRRWLHQPVGRCGQLGNTGHDCGYAKK